MFKTYMNEINALRSELKGEQSPAVPENVPKYLPYNETNILITKKDLYKILKEGGLNVRIANDRLNEWQVAFVHQSYISQREIELPNEKIVPPQKESNEKLEWLGDAIIQAVIGDYLYNRFPDKDQGFYTTIRSRLVGTKSLAGLAKHLDFGKFIVLSEHAEKINTRNHPKYLEDAFEAFVGIMYKYYSDTKGRDKAFKIAYTFFTTILEKVTNMEYVINTDTNYKHQLMKLSQKRFGGRLPVYETYDEKKNEGGHNIYYVRVSAPNRGDQPGIILGSGFGKSKKIAEQFSARKAINHRVFQQMNRPPQQMDGPPQQMNGPQQKQEGQKPEQVQNYKN